MTRQTSEPVEHTTLNATNRPGGFFAQFVAAGDIDLNPPYQRGSVWTDDQRIALIYSFLSGTTIPAVILNDRTYGTWRQRGEDQHSYAVIDGKQRILTVIAWLNGDLAVPASWFRPEFVETTTDTDDGSDADQAGDVMLALGPAVYVRSKGGHPLSGDDRLLRLHLDGAIEVVGIFTGVGVGQVFRVSDLHPRGK